MQCKDGSIRYYFALKPEMKVPQSILVCAVLRHSKSVICIVLYSEGKLPKTGRYIRYGVIIVRKGLVLGWEGPLLAQIIKDIPIITLRILIFCTTRLEPPLQSPQWSHRQINHRVEKGAQTRGKGVLSLWASKTDSRVKGPIAVSDTRLVDVFFFSYLPPNALRCDHTWAS